MQTNHTTTTTKGGAVKIAGLTDGMQVQKQVQRASAMLALRTRFQEAATLAAEKPAPGAPPRRTGRTKAGHWPSRMRLDDLALAS